MIFHIYGQAYILLIYKIAKVMRQNMSLNRTLSNAVGI